MATTCALSNEELKALYATIKLNSAKPKPTETAELLGVAQSTFMYRYNGALKKIETAFPELKDLGSGGAPPATPKKRKAKAKEGPTPKEEKGDSEVVKSEKGNAETPKKGKVDAPAAEEDEGKVKKEDA